MQQRSLNTVKCEALIFDLGNVVFRYTFDKAFEAWSDMYHIPVDQIRERFKVDDMFEKFERADISFGEFMVHISTELGIELTESSFEQGWNSIYMDKVDGIDQLLARLSRNYRLVGLTNTNIIHSKVWPGKYENTLVLFEKIFSSSEIKSRKPEKRAFQIVLDYLKLAPEQTIFLDDNIDNVKAAQEIGIPSICVISFEQMVSDLEKLNVVLYN